MYCSNCGKKIENNSKFCKYCGCNLEKKSIYFNINNFKLALNKILKINIKYNKFYLLIFMFLIILLILISIFVYSPNFALYRFVQYYANNDIEQLNTIIDFDTLSENIFSTKINEFKTDEEKDFAKTYIFDNKNKLKDMYKCDFQQYFYNNNLKITNFDIIKLIFVHKCNVYRLSVLNKSKNKLTYQIDARPNLPFCLNIDFLYNHQKRKWQVTFIEFEHIPEWINILYENNVYELITKGIKTYSEDIKEVNDIYEQETVYNNNKYFKEAYTYIGKINEKIEKNIINISEDDVKYYSPELLKQHLHFSKRYFYDEKEKDSIQKYILDIAPYSIKNAPKLVLAMEDENKEIFNIEQKAREDNNIIEFIEFLKIHEKYQKRYDKSDIYKKLIESDLLFLINDMSIYCNDNNTKYIDKKYMDAINTFLLTNKDSLVYAPLSQIYQLLKEHNNNYYMVEDKIFDIYRKFKIK